MSAKCVNPYLPKYLACSTLQTILEKEKKMGINKTLFDQEIVSGLAARAAVAEAYKALLNVEEICNLSSLGLVAFKEIVELVHQKETYEDSNEFVDKILKEAETTIDTMIRTKFFPDTLPKEKD